MVKIVIALEILCPIYERVRGEHTVGTSYYWVLMRSRGYGNFDLRIRFGKFWEFMSQERPVQKLESWSAIKQGFNGGQAGKYYFIPFEAPAQSQ